MLSHALHCSAGGSKGEHWWVRSDSTRPANDNAVFRWPFPDFRVHSRREGVKEWRRQRYRHMVFWEWWRNVGVMDKMAEFNVSNWTLQSIEILIDTLYSTIRLITQIDTRDSFLGLNFWFMPSTDILRSYYVMACSDWQSEFNLIETLETTDISALELSDCIPQFENFQEDFVSFHLRKKVMDLKRTLDLVRVVRQGSYAVASVVQPYRCTLAPQRMKPGSVSKNHRNYHFTLVPHLQTALIDARRAALKYDRDSKRPGWGWDHIAMK